jgi:branched-subunit amino acid transport protein
MATMNDVWLVVAGLAVVNVLLKAAGPWMLGEHELSHEARTRLMAVVPAVLAALLVVDTVIREGSVQVDARTAGVAAAAVAIWRRAPLVVVIGSAAAVTALGRAAGAG